MSPSADQSPQSGNHGQLRVIFASEYVRRVYTKAFLLTTLLVPAVVIAVVAVVGILVSQSVQSESARAKRQGVAVLDETGRLFSMLREAAAEEDDGYWLTAVPGPLATAKNHVRAGGHHGLLVLPEGLADDGSPAPIEFFAKKKQSVLQEEALRKFVFGVVREARLARHELSPEAYAALREPLIFNVLALVTEGEGQSGSVRTSGAAATAIAMVVFMVATIYGGAMMQAVMEEKSSRMAEIVVSSAGAFELLLGKILAVSAMAATQLGLWFVLLLAGGVALALALGGIPTDFSPAQVAVPLAEEDAGRKLFPQGLPAVRWDVVWVVLLMLPLGYLINASIFAALGAMHENPWEAQMSVTVAMLPMVLAFIVAQTIVFAPNSALVLVCAFLPFTAPAILPARMLLVDMPLWQVAFSVGLCVASTLGMVWLCGRIFRGSLLVYGKKLGWRDVRQVIFAD